MMDRSVQLEPVARLAEEFASRYRRGELPSIAEYVKHYPEHAAQIEELFPAVVLLERYRLLEAANRRALGTIANR